MVKIWIEDELLDMPENTRLQMQEGSPFFETDLQSGEYSVPFTIPLTERNRKTLGNPQRVDNADADLTYSVNFERAGKVISGVLYIDKINYDFNAEYGYAECTIAGVEGLFYSFIKDKMLRDLEFDGPYAIPEYTPITDYDPDFENTLYHSNACFWASDIANGVITDKPFVFPMIKWDNFAEWEEITYIDSTLKTPTLIEGFVNYYTVAPFNELNLDGPQYEGVTVLTAGPAYNRLIPMFYRKWVLQKIFEEYGYTLTGDFMDDAAFNKVVLINNFAINKWVTYDDLTHDGLYWIDYATEVNPRNHMPHMSVVDFINDTCANFNFRIIPVSDTEFTIIRKTELVLATEKHSIEPEKINPLIVKLVTETDAFRKGTNLAYTNSDEWLDSVLPKVSGTYRGEVATSGDLTGIASPSEGDIYSVTATGWVYRYSEQTGLFGLYSNNFTLVELTQFTNGNLISFEGTPLAMEQFSPVEENNGTVLNTYSIDALPHIDMAGMWYKNNGKLTEFVEMPLRQMLYMGLQYCTDDPGHPLPFCTYRNRNTDNTKLFTWALTLYGVDGIYDTFFDAWDAAKAASVKYEITTYVTETEISQMEFTKLVDALEQLYLLYQKKYTAPYTGVCSVQVYKLGYYNS